MPNSFFTILQNYLRCCTDRCYSNTNVDVGGSGDCDGSSSSGFIRDYSFDDLSPKTPISWSSSSSLEDYKVACSRVRPRIGIIPTNYYSD